MEAVRVGSGEFVSVQVAHGLCLLTGTLDSLTYQLIWDSEWICQTP
jgi:hypothetical protein